MGGNPWPVRYGVAVGAAVVALAAKLLLEPLLGQEGPFLLFFAAVLVSSYVSGLGPGLLTVGLCALFSDFFFLAPQYQLRIGSPERGLRLALFVLEGILVVSLMSAMRSARRRLEERGLELERSEERLRLAVETTGLGTWDFDPLTGELNWDDRTKRVFGLPPETEVDYETFLAGLHPHDRERIDRAVRRALHPESGGTCEMEYRTVGLQDGVERWVAARGRAFFDETGRAVRFTGTVLDVTERKRTEKGLREVREAERSRMARDLHDGALQDIAYALSEVELVQATSREGGAETGLDRAIEALQRAGQGLRETVYDLHLQGVREESLVRSARSMVELNRRMNPGCNIELNISEYFPGELPEMVNRELLHVLREALTNVRRHSGARHVRVALWTRKDELLAEVEDDGRGFEPGTTPVGMGLRSMRERVLALGGELEVHSEPGKGTRIEARVPLLS